MTASKTPAQWLLDVGLEGVALTQTNALGRVVVREAARLWPHWWNAELFGEPYREAELAPLESLHEGLRRLKLVRRRGKKLFTTPRGRELLADPAALHDVLASDIAASDVFTETVADVVITRLSRGAETKLDALSAAALERVLRQGWRVGTGCPMRAIWTGRSATSYGEARLTGSSTGASSAARNSACGSRSPSSVATCSQGRNGFIPNEEAELVDTNVDGLDGVAQTVRPHHYR